MKRIPVEDSYEETYSPNNDRTTPSHHHHRKYTLEEIDTLSLEELNQARQDVIASHNAALAQLGKAKAGAVENQYADPTWYRRCQAAIRFMSQVLARIKARRALLNEEKWRTDESAKMRRFIKLVQFEIGEDRTMQLLLEAENEPG